MKKSVLFLKKYLPMFLLICFSGNPIISHMDYSKMLLVVFTIIFLIYTLFIIDLQTFKNVSGILTGLIGLIFVIVFFQNNILGFVSYPGVVGFIVKILFSLTTLLYYKQEKIDFIDSYIKTLAFLAIVSIPFWILNQFGFYGIDTGNTVTKSLILYTSYDHAHSLVQGHDIIRNSGLFWEPGAFAGYIILALIFIALKNRKFQVGPYGLEVIFLLVGLITSKSTTGYIAFGVIIMIHSLQTYRLGKMIIVPLMILTVSVSYLNLDFMKTKIEDQISRATDMDEDETSGGRFGALKMDLQYIKSQPLTGNGMHLKTRYRFHPHVKDADIGHGNGMSNTMVVWGIPFLLFWLFCVYKFAHQVSKSIVTTAVALFVIILLLQGEQFLNYPIFISFFFLPFMYQNILSDKSKLHIIKTHLNSN